MPESPLVIINVCFGDKSVAVKKRGKTSRYSFVWYRFRSTKRLLAKLLRFILLIIDFGIINYLKPADAAGSP